ncbi:MAG: hypothetical protein MR025_08325 [Helicobacter trogontum]|nr:hypothetical protein [Helicobacter trogontum]MCI5787430.1 hypothetical protein [Helicobacter trogontum]
MPTFKQNNMPNFSSAGGYLSLHTNYYSKWLAFNYSLQTGLLNVVQHGHIQGLSNVNPPSSVGGFVLMDINAGLNLGSLKTPILLTLSLPINMYNLGWNIKQRLLTESIFMGFNLYSSTKLTNRFILAYQFGYGYNIWGRYRIDSYGNIAAMQGGHRFLLDLSLLYKRKDAESIFYKKQKADFYVSLKAIYYILEPSKTIHINNTPVYYNASNNLMLNLEFGIGFGISPSAFSKTLSHSP